MTAPKSIASTGIFCLLLTVAQQWFFATAISENVCINTAATWVTQTSHLTGQFPFYSLMFFCEGDLNLERRSVDSCINHGKSCGQPAADEFCQYLGFEGSAPTLFTTKVADEPARSMTGEWCVSEGRYEDLGYLNRTQLESVNSTVTGAYCERLESVVCFNSRQRLGQNNNNLHAAVNATTADLPPSSSNTTGSRITPNQVQLPPASVTGGRRRLLSSLS